MKKSVILLFSALLVLGLASGCSTQMTRYTQTVDISSTDFSKLDGMKKGEACISRAFIMVSYDNTIETAAKKAGITKVMHVEKKYGNPFSPFFQNCTIVYGK
ncbi:MAG: TRL-like family protein [Gammaproteobacteria bacterium]|nr:TRL-like family protein [Gammaproteobacteria bacterium]